MNEPLVTYLNDHLDDYLRELETLVRMDSYSFDRDDVNRGVDWLEERLRALNFRITRHPHAEAGDDLVAVRQGGGTGRILLLGHSDTVFPHGTTAERPLTLIGDTLLGPGTCDMKAGLLTGIYAVEALDAIGFDDYESITFLIVSDEEIDGRHSIDLIRSTSRTMHAGFTLEAARANGDIVTARKGVRSFTAEAFGHAAHSGVEPEKGRNAIVALAHQIIALHDLNDPASGISVNVGVVQGGRLRNIVPDYARLNFEARGFSMADIERVTEAIRGIFARQPLPDVRFDLSYVESSPPMPRTDSIALLEALAQRAAQELGFSVAGAKTGGAADAAYVAAEGVPVLDGLGPVGGLDHSPDEYILLSSIVPRTALLAKLMMAALRQFAA
jgi:glutamate carboxypeptidase